ncbi:CLUMA_CG013973, isoform A [Clunio marinus]|uniref:CLUMA_CG013973, isoform A n=1 Tax=Clunio marinus TaxID=568069 RepID=A0A1J1IMC6_9DIPT|nr:CLUMA_CG013973, isoform A [Clunio marinus]
MHFQVVDFHIYKRIEIYNNKLVKQQQDSVALFCILRSFLCDYDRKNKNIKKIEEKCDKKSFGKH